MSGPKRWPWIAGVLIDETTAPYLLPMIEVGLREFRLLGITEHPPEIARSIEGIRVMAGKAKFAPEIPAPPASYIPARVAASRLGITPQQVGRLAKNGVLPSIKAGGKLLVAEAAVDLQRRLRTSGNVSEPDAEGAA